MKIEECGLWRFYYGKVIPPIACNCVIVSRIIGVDWTPSSLRRNILFDGDAERNARGLQGGIIGLFRLTAGPTAGLTAGPTTELPTELPTELTARLLARGTPLLIWVSIALTTGLIPGGTPLLCRDKPREERRGQDGGIHFGVSWRLRTREERRAAIINTDCALIHD
jgi:hypothetical protein